MGGDLFSKYKCFSGKLRRELIYIRIMLLWKDKGVSFCGRTCVKDHLEVIILINIVGGNYPVCQFAENAIVFHRYSFLY